MRAVSTGHGQSRGVGGRAASVRAGAEAGATAAGRGGQATPIPPPAPWLSAQSVQALGVLQHFLDERRHGARDLHLQRDHPLGPCRRGTAVSTQPQPREAAGGRPQGLGLPIWASTVDGTRGSFSDINRLSQAPKSRGSSGSKPKLWGQSPQGCPGTLPLCCVSRILLLTPHNSVNTTVTPPLRRETEAQGC